MLQQESPEDYVISTGRTETVRKFIELVANKLNFKEKQTFINIDKYANTTAATIPIAMYDAIEAKRLDKDDNLIITTFGAGFTWGTIYMKWNIDG